MPSKYMIIAKELENSFPQMLHSGNTKLPSETELCSKFSCSRQTVRAALFYLQEKKLIVKCRGSGSYISGAASRKNTVALILPSTTEYIYPAVVRDINRYLSNNDFLLNVYATSSSIFHEREILKSLTTDTPAGIIMEASNAAQPCISSDILASLSENGIPIVYLFSNYSVPSSAVKIMLDERAGAFKLATTVLKNNLRKTVFIMRANDIHSFERYTGYSLACISIGQTPDEKDILWITDDEYERIISGEYSSLEHFIIHHQIKNCTFVCCNDEIAYHTVKLLKKTGIMIPDEVSVTGFDNSYYATQSTPMISSVGADNCSPAKEAAKAMISKLTGRKTHSALLPMSVILRQSTK